MQHTFSHLGIAVNAASAPALSKREGTEALGLYLTGLDDAFADGSRWFSWLHLRQLFEGNGLYFAMDIYTVE